jgi:glyoxylase-like metal-dependent hydrolase (beta-lactamase superfamily II)
VKLGKWQLDAVNGGTFRLDGGVMFGVVPKTLWQRVAAPDDLNRVGVANRCVLARNGRHTVLVDTGYGGKYAPLDRRFYDMEEGSPLLTSLSQLGVQPEQIDTVVFSHLHFDHVGGASYLDDQRRTTLTFPRARHVVGKIEWVDANSGAPELQTAYSAEDIRPLEDAVKLDLVDDDTEIVPGLRTRLTGGHTRGHLSLLFESDGEAALYIGDICPSTAHLRRMWGMSYDTEPIETRRRKPELLGEAADRRWWILWYHDPQVAACRLQRDQKREFIPTDILKAF